jgi:hypothetical protein
MDHLTDLGFNLIRSFHLCPELPKTSVCQASQLKGALLLSLPWIFMLIASHIFLFVHPAKTYAVDGKA